MSCPICPTALLQPEIPEIDSACVGVRALWLTSPCSCCSFRFFLYDRRLVVDADVNLCGGGKWRANVGDDPCRSGSAASVGTANDFFHVPTASVIEELQGGWRCRESAHVGDLDANRLRVLSCSTADWMMRLGSDRVTTAGLLRTPVPCAGALPLPPSVV